MNDSDERWMRLAIDAAIQAANNGEVPVGAVIVGRDGEFLAAEGNLTITNSDPTAHAEILVLRGAAAELGNYRLNGCTVYATIEPCSMCAGALVNARIQRLVFGAHDERFGAVASRFQLCSSEDLNHRIDVVSGVLADECRDLMQVFFRERRS